MKITYFPDIGEDTISDKFIYVKTFMPVSEYRNLLYEFIVNQGSTNCPFFKSVRHHTEIFIGYGLGAFWAYYNARKYDQNAILINPVLNPSKHLQEHLKFIDMNLNFDPSAFIPIEQELETLPPHTKEIHCFCFLGTHKKLDQEKVYIPIVDDVIIHVHNTRNKFPYGADLDEIIEMIKTIIKKEQQEPVSES